MFCTHTIGAIDLRLGDLLRRHVADAEVPDQALPLELDERLERFGERAGPRALGVAEPEVDHVERLEAEVLEVVVDGAAQALRRRGPGASRPAASRRRADLGDDVQRRRGTGAALRGSAGW